MELGVLAGEAYAAALTRAGVTVGRGSALFKTRPPTLNRRA